MSSEAPARKPSAFSRFAERFIETYQQRVTHRLASHCPFQPTCTQYGLEAYRRYGFLKATAKFVWRLARCNPWNKGSRLDPP
jgi:putative membrane protein insertion efficiency factor